MKTTVHPYKGYLNTEFRVYSHETDVTCYDIYHKGEDNRIQEPSIKHGKVSPNVPHSFKLNQPGKYEVRFDDSSSVDILVEDGYKFGGGRIKKAFIFDNCPWCFIVMHDRTYFYNRDTKQSYVEVISPDNIIEVATDYVIFTNDNQEEQTLFSLKEQKPILNISSICFYNQEILIWEHKIDGKETEKEVNVYSLKEQSCLYKLRCDDYSIDKKNNRIFFIFNDVANSINLSDKNDKTELKLDGHFIVFVRDHYAITKEHSFLSVYELLAGEKVGQVPIEGNLASVNNKKLINIYDRCCYFKNLNDRILDETELTAKYSEYIIYPCQTNIYYTCGLTEIKRHSRFCDKTEQNFIASTNTKLHCELVAYNGYFYEKGSCICFYNSTESLVLGYHYDGAGYIKDCRVYNDGYDLYKYDGESLRKLSNNGYWDNPVKGDFDLCSFEEFHILKDRKSDLCRTLYCSLGKLRASYNEYLLIDDFRYYHNGVVFNQDCPKYISKALLWGIEFEDEKIYLCKAQNKRFVFKERILSDIFDTSKYRQVILSEAGNQILYRDKDQTVLMDIENNQLTKFDNLSYVAHINGIRPMFSCPGSLQPVIVNPINGQKIDAKMLSQYQFISLDGVLYADTEIDKYIEYFEKITGKIISKNQYEKLKNDYRYPSIEDKDSPEWNAIKEKRTIIVEKNIEFLRKSYFQTGRWERCSDKILIDHIVTEEAYRFVDYFIGKRGIAYIRKVANDETVAKIDLGEPLWFLNYVSFSFDSRYVAIGGRYPNDTNKGGLFLVYDLIQHETLIKTTNSKAIWVTAFNQENMVAAYSSSPVSYFSHEQYDNDSLKMLVGYNFLTFSPDGKYIALSNQGYIAKYDKNGNERSEWGHEPSTTVSISLSAEPDKIECVYNDLSEIGIYGSLSSKTVASVSFANNNSRLMMVGNDETVVIRNLHL